MAMTTIGVRRAWLGVALVGAMLAIAPAAKADEDGWRKHHHHHYYGGGPYYGPYYYKPPKVRYYAPPVYYAPAPVIYGPPVYYAPAYPVQPGISLGINVPLR